MTCNARGHHWQPTRLLLNEFLKEHKKVEDLESSPGIQQCVRPKIDTATSRLTLGHRHLRLTGSRFQGISQASGGNTQDSSSNYPIVQLRSLDNSQVPFVPVDPVRGWSDTTFKSVAMRDFPKGPALVTVFTNGIPSTAKYLVIARRQA